MGVCGFMRARILNRVDGSMEGEQRDGRDLHNGEYNIGLIADRGECHRRDHND